MLDKKQINILEHTLGGEDPDNWFRNHFVAHPGHTDLPDIEILQKHGFMKQVEAPSFCGSDTMLFRVTEEGQTYLKEKRKKKEKKKEIKKEVKNE